MLLIAVAAVATAGLALLYSRPWTLFAILAVLNAAVLIRWHSPADVVRWLIGATLGNAAELLCDLGGVWVHSTRQWLDAAPFNIFLCYPVLMLAVPRLLGSSEVDGRKGGAALGLFIAHIGLSAHQGGDNSTQSWVSGITLAACLMVFHRGRDFAAGLLGMGMGLVWEIPCTALGSWTFPNPQALGLIPYWLPFAYAVFFMTTLRIGDALIALRLPRPQLPIPLESRRQSGLPHD